jgi:hypothetical protein
MSRSAFARLIPLWAVLGLGAAWLGCTGEQSMAFTAVCSTTMNVAGYWAGSFRCENGDCITGSDRFNVQQEVSDLTQVTVEIVDSSLPDDIGVIMEGELCGNTFTWAVTDPGNDESGTWTFTDLQHFSKTSTFGNGQYTCVGQGTKSPLPLPPDYFCPLP